MEANESGLAQGPEVVYESPSDMWILVIGPDDGERDGSGVSCLRELGCRVRIADLWDPLDERTLGDTPPAVVLIEALDEVDAGRAALVRVQAAPMLRDVPVMIGVTVNALTRLDPQAGYDDFILYPYVPVELYSRIRRAEWRRSDFTATERIKVGELCLDVAAHEVTVDDRPVRLTHQEFALLRFLCRNRGRVYSRHQLLEHVWGVDYYGSSRTVDIHVRRLRMKLGRGAAYLETVRGVGYKMSAP